MLCSPVAHAAPLDFNGAPDGNYFFRFKGGEDLLKAGNPVVAKDIVAYYIGGVGFEFSEKLPIKPQWLGLTWKVVKGTLPDGIRFNNATRIFSGTPTEEGLDRVVEMIGYRADGAEEATAQINFDIVDMLGDGRQVTLYAHTGKYKYDELPIPANVTVNSWTADAVMTLPPGISVDGPYFQGIPTQAGRYPVLIRGMDYLGEVILTYLVNYVVEDGPTFDVIPDDIRTLAPAGIPGWHWSGFFDFGAPNPYAVNYAIDPSKPVRYFLRIDDEDGSLPGKLRSNSDPLNLNIQGFANEPYDTVRAHFFAIDSDGTAGPSNTFTFGTGDPTPACRQYPQAPEYVTFYTGRDVNAQLAIPFGSQGTVKFTMTDGKLPDGLTLEDGGRIVGVTKAAQPKTDISVLIEVINDESTLSAQCNYTIEVKNEILKLIDSTPDQNRHGRVGDPYSGQITARGSIPDFTIDWTAGVAHPTLEAAVPAENQVTVPVRGTFEKAGSAFYSFTIVNGDTNTAAGDLELRGYGQLSFGNPRTFVPNFTVKRLDYGTWGAIPYDAATVVPDMSGATAMPDLDLGGSSDLPSGVDFDGRKFGGMTRDDSGQYGPFTVTMSDFTGDSVVSDPFYVNVVAREGNVITSAPDQSFMVEQTATQYGAQPSVKYPAGARGYTRTWKLIGPDLPSWAHFDPATGVISADPRVPFGDLAQPANRTDYGPYTLTVSDDDPVEPSTSAPSSPFYVRLTDMKAPAAGSAATVRGTVSGDADAGFSTFVKSLVGGQARQKTVTTISVGDFNSRISPSTIVGTIDQVIFTHSEPSAPAGVPLQISADGHSAWFEGSPTEPYEGTVQVFFKDIRGRVGAVPVQMVIKPYPTVAMTAGGYDLPRLAPAADYGIQPNGCIGCWYNPTWEVDPSGSALPPGLTINPSSGAIVGFTEELDEETAGTRSPFSGIVLKATSKGANGEDLLSWTEPFEIRVKPRVPMTLDYPDGTDVWYLNDKTNFKNYTFNYRDLSAPHVGGSHRPVVKFLGDTSGLLPSQGLNTANGVFTWDLNSLTLGRFSTEVTATDTEGQTATDTLDIKATLEGEVHFVSGGGALKLRQSESFMTGDPKVSGKYAAPIVVDRVVGEMSYDIGGNPPSVNFLKNGLFLEGSRFDQSGISVLLVSGKDSDDRGLDIRQAIRYSFDIVPPLAFQQAGSATFAGRQYSAEEPIAASFPVVENVMDSLEFEIVSADGKDLPGTIVYKVYDADGNFGHWQWSNADGSGNIVPAQDPFWKNKLPLDALVFDQADMSLKGIPSKDGTFKIRLVAKDTYRNSYLHQDDVNYPAEQRQENNTAATEVTLDVAPAHPLLIVNKTREGESSSETLAQYTQAASMRGVVTNAAYGLPLTWTKLTGTVPEGVQVSTTSIDLAFGLYAKEKGLFQNITYKGVDRAGREIVNQPISFTVGERQPFELVATANPKNMAVFLTDADLTVSPKNQAYGRNIGKKNWTVTGQANLPPGVSMSVDDRVVRFSGKSSKVGSYGPIIVSAVDAINAHASISLTLEVRIPDGPIILNVSDIKTKQTYPFQMQATASNTYGTVRFYSYALTGSYAKNMSLNEATGFVQGKFNDPQRFSFDTYVTDETNRVTSRPISVEVIPFLRITVPQTVKATETIAMTQSVATDYVLGSVVYEKGKGTWPAGLTVNPATGAIGGTPTSEPGTFSGLTIKATDTFKDFNGTSYTDVQESNAFEIALDGIPEISDVDSTAVNRLMLYTKDTAAGSWKPKVIDKITKKTWSLPNTTYSINKDIEFDTGLKFDTATGEISGTPTKLVVYTDLTITVSSPHGNTDTTRPFWFAVQPQGTIWARPGQTDEYRNRVGTLLATDAPIFDNTVGNVLYTATGIPAGMTIDAATGVVSGTPTTAATWTVIVTARDAASRTATFTYKIVSQGVLTLTLAKPTVGVNIGQTYTALNAPTATNIGGAAAYTAVGLPQGLSVNPSTGAIDGSPSNTIANNTQFPVTIRLTDNFDGGWKEISYTLTVALPILPAAGQKSVYNLRHNEPFTSDAPVFTNAVGAVTYSMGGWAAGQGGLTLDASTGVLSGTPVFVGFGTYPNYFPPSYFSNVSTNVVVTVTDSTGRTGTLQYIVTTRRELTLTLANPTVAIDFDKSYTGMNKPTATNGGGTLTYTATGLPDGLTVNPLTGAIEGSVASGLYQAGDRFGVVVTVKDSFDNKTADVSYTLTVADPLTVVAGQTTAYAVRAGDTLTVDLPKFENALGAVTFTQSGKPTWLSFSATDGAASGVAPGTSNNTVTVTITDSINRTATFVYTIASRNALGLTLAPTVDGLDFGKSYSSVNKPTASNVAGTASYEDVGGIVASTGLTFSTADAGLSGTVSNNLSHGDKFQAVVRLRDSYDDLRAQLASKGNVATPSGDATPFYREVTYPLTATEAIVPTAGQTSAYSVRVGDTLTVDPPKFDKLVGTAVYTQTGKPAWMSFSAVDGGATGVANAAANSTVTVTVKDATLRTATFTYTVTSRGALGLALTPSVNGVDFGKTYGATNVPAASNVAGTSSFEDVGNVIGSTGLTFNTSTGGFSGQISSSLTHGQTVHATVRLRDTFDLLRLQLIDKGNVAAPVGDTTPGYREVKYDLTPATALVVTPGQKTAYIARVGEAIATDPISVDNMIGTPAFAATGVPSGLYFDPATGRLSGTVAAAGNYTIVVTARDSTLRTTTFTYTLTTKGVLSLALASPVTDIWQSTGNPYVKINTPTATNVGGAASYAVTGLPTEFTFDAQTGSISGTVPRGSHPNGSSYPVTVTVTDSFDNQTKQVSYTLVLRDAPDPTISVAPVSTGYATTSAAVIATTITNAKKDDVVALAPGSAQLPPGFSIVQSGSVWQIAKAATSDSDIGVYKGIKLRITDVDGRYGETGAFDLILRSATFLSYAPQTVEARADVPVDIAERAPSAGIPIKDLTFSFSTDTTGGTLTINPATGALSGTFNKNGTNVVKVVESYDGKPIREFNYSLTLKVVQLSVKISDFAVMSDVAATRQVIVENAHPTAAYELTGNVPAGLTVNSTGLITGTATVPGIYSANVVYEDDYALVTVPVKITVLGTSATGHKFWKVTVSGAATSGWGFSPATLYEIALRDAGNNDVTQIGSVSGYPAVFDGNFASGITVSNGTIVDIILTYDKKVAMSNAVATGRSTSSGSTYLYVSVTYYWSDDGVTWVKAGGTTTVPYNFGSSATVTTTITN
jgi:hypothetical protein